MTKKERKAAYNAKYHAKPENKARAAELARRPEVLARNAEYKRRPDVRARNKALRQHPCHKAQAAEYASRPEVIIRRRELERLRTTGVGPTEFNFTLAGQNFCCGKCGADHPGGKKDWNADHCHETGRFRGVLCLSCNTSIGKLGDNVEGLLEAIEYIVGETLPTNLTKQILQMAGRANLSLLTAPNAKPPHDYKPATSSQNTNEPSRRSA